MQSSPVHRCVEQSNLLMEQRNHSLQTTNENTQARVLHAEQEKVMVTMSSHRPLTAAWKGAACCRSLVSQRLKSDLLLQF